MERIPNWRTGTVLIDAQPAAGVPLYGPALSVGTYGGDEVTLVYWTGVPGRVSVEASCDLGITWPVVLKAPTAVSVGGQPHQLRLSTLTTADGHPVSATSYRLRFDPEPLEPRFEAIHLGGNGQVYRDAPTPRPSLLTRWAASARRLFSSTH